MGEVARDNNNKKTEQMSMQGITDLRLTVHYKLKHISCLNYIFLAEFDVCNLMCP